MKETTSVISVFFVVMQCKMLTFDSKNYEGAVFASELARKLNLAVVGFVPLPVMICTYDVSNNILTISMTDARTEANILPIRLQILTDDTLTLGPPRASSPNTINTIIRNTNQPVITVAESYKCYPEFFSNTKCVFNLIRSVWPVMIQYLISAWTL